MDLICRCGDGRVSECLCETCKVVAVEQATSYVWLGVMAWHTFAGAGRWTAVSMATATDGTGECVGCVVRVRVRAAASHEKVKRRTGICMLSRRKNAGLHGKPRLE